MTSSQTLWIGSVRWRKCNLMKMREPQVIPEQVTKRMESGVGGVYLPDKEAGVSIEPSIWEQERSRPCPESGSGAAPKSESHNWKWSSTPRGMWISSNSLSIASRF